MVFVDRGHCFGGGLTEVQCGDEDFWNVPSHLGAMCVRKREEDCAVQWLDLKTTLLLVHMTDTVLCLVNHLSPGRTPQAVKQTHTHRDPHGF